MKLDRTAGFAVIAALAMFGCASQNAQQPAAPVPHVATTQLMAAEITDADDAPRVGKSHLSSSKNDDADAKDSARHDRKHGGGFSGWK